MHNLNTLVQTAFIDTVKLPTTGILTRAFTLDDTSILMNSEVSAVQQIDGNSLLTPDAHTGDVDSADGSHTHYNPDNAFSLLSFGETTRAMEPASRGSALDMPDPGIITLIVDPQITDTTLPRRVASMAQLVTSYYNHSAYPISNHIVLALSGWYAGAPLHFFNGIDDVNPMTEGHGPLPHEQIASLDTKIAQAARTQLFDDQDYDCDALRAGADTRGLNPLLTDIDAPVTTDHTRDLTDTDALLDRVVTYAGQHNPQYSSGWVLHTPVRATDPELINDLAEALDNEDTIAEIIALSLGDPTTRDALITLLEEISVISTSHLMVIAASLTALLNSAGKPEDINKVCNTSPMRIALQVLNAELLTRHEVSDIDQEVFDRTIMVSGILSTLADFQIGTVLARMIDTVATDFNPHTHLSPLVDPNDRDKLMNGRFAAMSAIRDSYR